MLSAPLLGDDAVLDKLLAHAVGVGGRLIDLVDGNHDGRAGGVGVVDGLDGLRHDAVVGGNHENDDVGDLCTTGTHGGKCLVTRGVDEGDLTAVDDGLRGTNVLRNAAGLAGGNGGVANGVKQRGLAVVDVAHDRDDRSAGLEVLRVVIEGEGVLLLLVHDLHAAAHIVGDELDEVIGHGLRERKRGTKQEETLDDVVGRNLEGVGELGDGDALANLHDVEVGGVLVVGDCVGNGLLVPGLLSGKLTTLLALLAAAGLTAGLLHGSTGLGQNAVAAVLLGAAGSTLLGLRCGLGVLLQASLRRGALASLLLVGFATGRLATLLAAVLAASVATIGALLLGLLGLLGGGSLFLLLVGIGKHALLLGDLSQKARERGGGLGGGVAGALALLLGTTLLLLGLAGSLFVGATLLFLGAAGGLDAALLLATGLGGKTLLLGLAGGLLGSLLLSLLCGLLLSLDLCGALLHDGSEVAADDGNVSILQRGRGALGGNLHIGEMLQHLLAGHAVFLGKLMNSNLGHVCLLSLLLDVPKAQRFEFIAQTSVRVGVKLYSKRPVKPLALPGGVEALRRRANVRASPSHLSRGVECNTAVGLPYESYQV